MTETVTQFEIDMQKLAGERIDRVLNDIFDLTGDEPATMARIATAGAATCIAVVAAWLSWEAKARKRPLSNPGQAYDAALVLIRHHLAKTEADIARHTELFK